MNMIIIELIIIIIQTRINYNLLQCDWCTSCVIVTNHSVQLSVIGQIHLGQASPVETASKGKDSSVMVIPQ